jgi:cytochrome P450
MSAGPVLDRERVRELFDLRDAHAVSHAGRYDGDPYPAFHRLRRSGPVHAGIIHELIGFDGPATYHGLPFPDRPHFSVFSWRECDAVFRDDEVFASSPDAVDPDLEHGELGALTSMLTMGGARHRSYRGLVQPSFVPARAEWWIRNWIEQTVHALIDGFVQDGHCELNVDFCAAIPVLTITGSFGIGVDQALELRSSFDRPDRILAMLQPVVAARRAEPQDDLISVLVEAELTDDEGRTHRLSDAEIASFSLLLLQAGSGTTWKQLGIALTALLARPALLRTVTDDRSLLRPAVEESLRWMPNLPMFSRWATRDVELAGVTIPAGAVVHLCLGAANRDPERWDHPDDFDPSRPVKPTLAFGGGPHVCLGMHVARAEMMVGIGAVLDRLPNLRLDHDADPPRIVGMYERGATAIPVLFG